MHDSTPGVRGESAMARQTAVLGLEARIFFAGPVLHARMPPWHGAPLAMRAPTPWGYMVGYLVVAIADRPVLGRRGADARAIETTPKMAGYSVVLVLV